MIYTQRKLLNRRMPDGCVLNYDFKYAGDKIIDSSDRFNHGTNSGSTPVTAHYGYAMDFDGSDDYIFVPNTSSINNLTKSTHIIAIYLDGYGENGFGRIIDKTASGANGYVLYLDGTNQRLLFARYFDIMSFWGSANGSIVTGKWYVIAVTYDKSSKDNDPTLYINGVSSTFTNQTRSTGNATDDTSNDLYIGNRSDGARAFDGKIKFFSQFNRILTFSEIKTEFIKIAWKLNIAS